MHAPTRMFLTLCLPALIAGICTLFAGVHWRVFQDVTAPGPFMFPMEDLVVFVGAVVAMVLYWAAVWRFRKWQRGCSACCRRCGCALGRTRVTATGNVRSCLGCGATHSA